MTMPMPPLVDAEARARAPALRGAGAAVLLAGAAGLAGAAALARFLDDGALVFAAAVLLACGAGLVLWLAARHLAARTFGAANAVTLVRGTLVVLLAASLGAGATAALAWIVVGLGAAAAALDAVDGVLARRRGESSAFGARFDMEVDALLILVLAALAWQHGKRRPLATGGGAIVATTLADCPGPPASRPGGLAALPAAAGRHRDLGTNRP
jgi:hypothetical protein